MNRASFNGLELGQHEQMMANLQYKPIGGKTKKRW